MSRAATLAGLANLMTTVALLGAAACGGDGPEAAPWTLVWSDEFAGPAGAPPDASKWRFALGGDGWGNQELQLYTERPDNGALDGNGALVITARREAVGGNAFTSARIFSKGHFEQVYGRFEARLRLPSGRGFWPAFWMLGANVDAVGWPKCGEIDIMEERGAQPWRVSGAVHGPGHSGGNALIAGFEEPGRVPLSNDFHVYAVDWDAEELRFYVDDQQYHSVRKSRMPPAATWVYDHPFFLLLNLSVGGNFGGPPDETTPFPETLVADYVRVYAR